MSTDTMTTPRIYVASLSDYNAGILHGEWIDAAQDADDLHAAIEDMLAASPTAAREGQPAEEWAIHDHEGFGGIAVGEYTDMAWIAKFAAALEDADEPEAFAAWIANDPHNEPEDFADAYRGRWSSVEDYAAEYVESAGILGTADPLVVQYFDYAAFARDLVMGGDIWTAPADLGDVYIFDANA